jgi:uncharacterized protein YbjT (DUF2867 family)
MLGDASKAIPMVATRDIAAVAAEALLDSPRGIIELEGPARHSPREVAALVAELLGRDVKPIDVPFEAQEAQLQSFGISANVAALFREMNEGIARDHVAFAGGEAARRKGAQTLKTTLAAMT